jgi:hypothetical protein
VSEKSIVREPLDPELFDAVRDFVLEARSKYVMYRQSSGYVSKIHDPKKYSEFKSGFPHITRDFKAEIPDYEGPFGFKKSEWTPIVFTEWDSFRRLLEIADRHKRWQTTFFADKSQKDVEPGKSFWLIGVSRLPLQTFDRLMHLYGEDFTDDQLCEVYCQLEQGIVAERLQIVIAAPILLTKFDTKVFSIDTGMAVMEMPEEMHLSLASHRGSPTSSVNEVVSAAATHMLTLVGWSMVNDRAAVSPPYMRFDWYPVDKIDQFFDSLRVATGIETGYAEVFILPEGQAWAYAFTRDLPITVQGASARRYPLQFDNYGWLVERETVEEKQLGEVAKVYSGMKDRHSIELAGRRLSAGMLRENEDDAILDLLIGLEAMLSDRDKGELTFKLAVRTAAVLAALPGHDPGVVFGHVKQLYNYRSAVAHGDAKRTAKLRTLDVGGEQVSSIGLATSFLREVVRQLVKRPDLAAPSDIDSKLVLRSLARFKDSDSNAEGTIA